MSSAEKNDLLICAFLQRLKSLQGLCCSNNAELPDALLFIPGQDGRHNKGSSTILKYLFQGSVGKELFEGVLDSNLECLEETALLIQESSVSIFYGTEAKKLIGPLLSCCPLLIEYMTTEAEEEEVDLFQARKCVDFKRMLLESVPEGGVIGMSVPIGYDEVQDTETWPLLQSFALDDVYCSTGFFSARYAIVDITDHLNIIFNTIDSFYVEKALTVIHQSILPHTLQTLSILEVSNAEQRERMTIETVLSPFDLLFEFGDMESTTPVDPALQPVLLPGAMSAYLGSPVGSLPSHWKQEVLGHSLHAVLEGFEPSTGMRWCRTYFLHTPSTTATDMNTDPATRSATPSQRPPQSTALPGRDVDDDDEEVEERQHLSTATATTATAAILYHLQYVYMKLWLGLRQAVTEAFQKNHDVLEAGKEVQDIMESLLHPNASSDNHCYPSSSSSPTSPLLLPPIHQLVSSDNNKQQEEISKRAVAGGAEVEEEVLQVHMDCLDGSGRVVSIEDVDDMEGHCWVYIRVSIHGILCGPDQQDMGSVAVGDTFLFTSKLKPLHSMITSTATSGNGNSSTTSSGSILTGLVADKYCLTHSLPYFRQYVGSGLAEGEAQELNAHIRNNHMLATLGMGALFDSEDNNEVVLPVVLDHICYPLIAADLRLFTTGFVIQRRNHITCLPVVVSIAEHVERVWTIDTDSCWNELNKLSTTHRTNKASNNTNVATNMSTQYLPEGFFIIFQLKKELSPKQLALLLANQNDEKKQQDENNKKKKKTIIQEDEDEDNLVGLDKGKGAEEKQKDQEDEEEEYDEDEEEEEELMDNSDSKNITKVYKNPLKSHLPAIYRKDPPRHLALLIREDSREFPKMSRILSSWRRAFREYEIEEHRGASSAAPLPPELLDSLLCAVDQWSGIAERKELAEGGTILPLVPAKELVLAALDVQGPFSQLASGFTQLRCCFALSQSLPNTSYSEQLIQSILSKPPPTNPTKVVMLFGVPGSGVVSVAHAIYSRLTSLSERSSPSSPPSQEGFQVLDLTVYDRSEGGNTSDVSRLIAPMVGAAKGKSLVIAVILSVTTYIPSVHILQRVSQLDHAAVVWAGAVLSASTTDGRYTDPPLGALSSSESIVNASLQPERDAYRELRRSFALESLATGSCDAVFIIDSKTTSSGSSSSSTNRRYETAKADAEMRNSFSDICRINAALHIDESVLESIADALTTSPSPSTSITTTQRSCLSLLRSGGSGSGNAHSSDSDSRRQSYFSLSHKGLGVRCVPITLNDDDSTTAATAAATSMQWDFHLLAYCLQKIFPTAASHSLLTIQEKYHSNSSRLTRHLEAIEGFQRIIFSSKVRVMRQRQQEEGKKQLEQLFRNFDEKAIVRLQSAIISVHGLFTVPGSLEGLLSVEGCGESIFLKSMSSPHSSSKSPSHPRNEQLLNQLFIYGAFQDQEIQILTSLFKHCRQVKLSYRPALEENDLSLELKTKLQEDTTLEIPLPSGWWFDGNAYIDIHGTRRNIRPDIGEVVKVYLAKRNAQVKAYNTILEEVIDFL